MYVASPLNLLAVYLIESRFTENKQCALRNLYAWAKRIEQLMLTVHFDSLKVSIWRFTENEQCALRSLYAWAKHIQQHMLTVHFDSLKFSILTEMNTIWKNSCFLEPSNCVVQRSRVWQNLYFLGFLQCVFQKSSAWHCLYWVAKVQSKTWAVCLGIACIEFVKLMIQSTWFYLIGNCITIVRDDEISFHIQHDPSRKTTHEGWLSSKCLGCCDRYFLVVAWAPEFRQTPARRCSYPHQGI